MKRINTRWLPAVMLLVMVLALTAGLVLASGETLPRSLVSSGGGLVSEGGYLTQSALGQPIVGAVENEAVLCSGFFCGEGAPPAPPIIGGHHSYLPVMVR